MLDNSTFISFACDEAEDEGILLEFGKMIDKKNLKIFANSNFTNIKSQAWEETEGKKSILDLL